MAVIDRADPIVSKLGPQDPSNYTWVCKYLFFHIFYFLRTPGGPLGVGALGFSLNSLYYNPALGTEKNRSSLDLYSGTTFGRLPTQHNGAKAALQRGKSLARLSCTASLWLAACQGYVTGGEGG